jgi:large subunit ribosomal protein L30
MSARLRVTQTRSLIGHPPKIRKVIEGLGLGRIGKSVTVDNTPSFRGMIKKIVHLVEVEKVKKDGSTELVVPRGAPLSK